MKKHRKCEDVFSPKTCGEEAQNECKLTVPSTAAAVIRAVVGVFFWCAVSVASMPMLFSRVDMLIVMLHESATQPSIPDTDVRLGPALLQQPAQTQLLLLLWAKAFANPLQASKTPHVQHDSLQ